MAEILYRKWRPTTFAELAGQEHVATTLRNALGSGRVSHAYLFSGPRGTGKTSTGRLLAKALNCTDRRDGEPCNACDSCQAYLAGRALDLVEMDAASNRGIEDIRNLRERVAFAPGSGAFKVYLIDEVHMLTEAAFNALLKTLEEPPPHVVFILATTEAHKVPATIASRCQRFDFRRMPLAAAIARLRHIADGEGFAVEPAALELIARSSTGSMRDAVNLLDQLVTSYGQELSVEHVRAGLGLIDDERARRLSRQAIAGELGGGLETIASVRDDGLDLRQFQRQVLKELRALLLVKTGLEPKDGVTVEEKRDMEAAVADVPVERILAAMRAFGEADLKPDPNSTLALDIALADITLEGAAAPQAAAAARPTRPAAQELVRPGTPRREAVAPTSGPREPAVAPRREGPSPRARQAPADNGAEPEAVLAAREALQRVYDVLKEVHLRALLNSGCDIIEASDESVTLGFRFPNHAQKMQEPQNLRPFTEALSRMLGREVAVSCVHQPGIEAWKTRLPASRSPLVRAAQEMGARVLPRDEE